MWDWIKKWFVKEKVNDVFDEDIVQLSKAEKIARSIRQNPEKWRWGSSRGYTITTRTHWMQDEVNHLEIWIGSEPESSSHISIYGPQKEAFSKKDQKVIHEAFVEWACVARRSTFNDKLIPMFSTKINDQLVDNLLKE